jgi:hypothetical protein
VDVCVDILRTVVLDYPVNCREVDSSTSNISGEEASLLLLHKFKENRRSFSLFLASVEFIQGVSDLEGTEGFIKETDLFA